MIKEITVDDYYNRGMKEEIFLKNYMAAMVFRSRSAWDDSICTKFVELLKDNANMINNLNVYIVDLGGEAIKYADMMGENSAFLEMPIVIITKDNNMKHRYSFDDMSLEDLLNEIIKVNDMQ